MKWFIVLLSLISFSVLAGDMAKLKLIGFSGAGNYLAYQQYWISDGEDAALVESHLIDVSRNRHVIAPIKHHHPDSNQLFALISKNLQAAQTHLKKYDIQAGNSGDLLVSQHPNHISANAKQVSFSVGTPLANMPNIKYQLKLEELNTNINCGSAGNAKKLKLTLINEGTKKQKILQQDNDVPNERGCPIRYRIQDVYTYHEEFIVVFINVFQMGFEGDNMRYMVVTGTLN